MKVKCGLCGRALDKRRARRAPIVGYVGSTCYQKVSAVNDVLRQNKLDALIDGSVRVTRDDVRNGNDPLPKNARRIAYELGLMLMSHEECDADGEIIAVTFWLEMRSGKALRRGLQEA